MLDLELDNALIDEVPRSVQARVLPATVFGTSFLDLTRARRAAAGASRPAT